MGQPINPQTPLNRISSIGRECRPTTRLDVVGLKIFNLAKATNKNALPVPNERSPPGLQPWASSFSMLTA